MKRACAFCRHSAGAHTHYRSGTECSVYQCDCPRYLGRLRYRLTQLLSR